MTTGKTIALTRQTFVGKVMSLITRFNRKLSHFVRTQETEIGSIFSDALRNSLGLDIMLLGSGSIRSDEMGPIVMLTDLMVGFPYDDKVYMLKVSGEQLKQMILYMVRDEVWAGVHTEFYQLSEGLHVVYSKADHEFKEFTYQGEKVDDDWVFTLGLQEFHYNHFQDIFNIPLEEIAKNGTPRIVCTSCRSVIEEYLTAHQHLDHKVGDRLVIL